MSYHILIVDDEPVNLKVLEGILFPLEYQISSAANGEEALKKVEENPPDLILLDVMMPGLSGFDVCQRLKSASETQFIPIVLVTALADKDSRVTGIECGADDFITKPVDQHELRARIKSLLRIKSLYDELESRNRALERMERTRQTLSQMVMHDFRTPVTGAINHARQVASHLQNAMECQSVVVFLQSPRDEAFWVMAKEGVPDHILGKVKLSVDSPLIKQLVSKGTLDINQQDIPHEDAQSLEVIGSVLLAPMMLKDELLGVISLGKKEADVAYTTHDMAFLEAVANQVAVGIDHVRLREQAVEFTSAHEIQRRLLPTSIPHIKGYEISGTWHPARTVSGDYYDVLPLSDNRFGLCIADVVGKGMPAALLMSNVQAAVKTVATENQSPHELCEHVNRVLYSNIDVGRFVTFFYGILDVAEQRLVYTNAGHNHPILVRGDGTHEVLEAGGTVLGIFEDCLYSQEEIALTPQDRMVMYTDGVTEMRNEIEEEYGEDRLIDLVTKNRHLDATALQEKVLSEVTAFSSGETQDDVTLLVLAAT